MPYVDIAAEIVFRFQASSECDALGSASGRPLIAFRAFAREQSAAFKDVSATTGFRFVTYNRAVYPRYCSADDIYDVFGKENVHKWARMEGTEGDPEIDARIDRMILFATADINDKLRGGPYTIPFAEGSIPLSVQHATALKAGLMLYEHRGADDMDYEGGQLTHRYSFLQHRADTMLEEVRRDARRLSDSDSTRVGSNNPGYVDK